MGYDIEITEQCIVEQLEKIEENIELFGREHEFTKMRIEELVELMAAADETLIEAGIVEWAHEYTSTN